MFTGQFPRLRDEGWTTPRILWRSDVMHPEGLTGAGSVRSEVDIVSFPRTEVAKHSSSHHNMASDFKPESFLSKLQKTPHLSAHASLHQ